MSELACPRCGQSNRPDANFCSVCGAELPGDPLSESTATHPVLPGPETSGDVAIVVVTRGANAGSRFAVGAGTTTIGRHPDSTIFLDDVTVSRRHAEIIARDSGYLLSDVGSLNGTYLNGVRIEQAAMAEGDQIQIGKYKMVFVVGAPTGDH